MWSSQQSLRCEEVQQDDDTEVASLAMGTSNLVLTLWEPAFCLWTATLA